ncbi:MAG: DivIVA domain-containing protein [Nocardioidaceae bacterium]
MIWVLAIVMVLVLGGLVAFAAGRDGGLRPTFDDRRDVLVPADRPLTAEDLAAVRFTTAARGYRMSEVDALLVRLRVELSARDHGEGDRATGPVEQDDARTAPSAPPDENRDD